MPSWGHLLHLPPPPTTPTTGLPQPITPSPVSFFPTTSTVSLWQHLCNTGSAEEEGRRERDEGTEELKDGGGSETRGLGPKRPGAITCPGTQVPFPAALAHLDSAGLTGHLVHLPPSLNAKPFHRGAPHVGASRSHVRAPPPPPSPSGCPGQLGPFPGSQTGRGRYAALGWEVCVCCPCPLPRCQVPEKSWGRRGARSDRPPGLPRRDRRAGLNGGMPGPADWAEPSFSSAPRLVGREGVYLTPWPPCG